MINLESRPLIPSLAEVERITAIADPVICNLQITQCYHLLSALLAWRLGRSANWCTFATWASRQAGQTIRKEDLKRLLESRLSSSVATRQAAADFAGSVPPTDRELAWDLESQALKTENFSGALERASTAVGRGNKKVFEEIGREFARFYAYCLDDQEPDEENIARFCEALRPGDPPEGQRYLRQAFRRYYQSFFEQDAKVKAELILLANIEIGFHEQTRLQPEIAESLDAGLVSAIEFTRRMLAIVFPNRGWLRLAQLYARRLLGRPNALDKAINDLLAAVRIITRQTLTEIMMSISLPAGVQLKLGTDLKANFPDSLRQITNPDLKALLERLDPTPDSLADSGALDWADLPDRLHFIIDLFRSYQEYGDLFAPPFTAEQVEAFTAGRLPGGRL